MDSPLHQFKIQELIHLNLWGFDLSFTNAALFMVLSVGIIFFMFSMGTRKMSLVPGAFQSIAESLHEFVSNLLDESTAGKGKPYVPFVLSIFLFVLMGNLLGMIPYGFTFTSQLILTFGLAAIVFLVVIGVGVYNHGFKFLHLFLPEGAPLIMAPLLIPIEVISFLSRPVSLSVRLFANMMAGHTMLKVFAMFTISLGVYGLSTVVINSILIGFEFLVAFLQAYVFTVLTCLYLNDAIHLHS